MSEKVAKAIKEFRENAGITQGQFAILFGTSQAVISDIETGKAISRKMAKKLSVLMGEDVSYFLKKEDAE